MQRFYVKGKMSWFGGPADSGMTALEGLALIEPGDIGSPAFRDLFINGADPAKGLGRQLNPEAFYLACRWDYSVTPKGMLRQCVAVIRNPLNGGWLLARPVDFGPAKDTGRVADLSPGILDALALTTDDDVEVFIT